MPGSVWNNQCSCPSQACQANQKTEEDKQSCAAVLRTEWSTSGASDEDQGTECTLNGPLSSPRKTFGITQHTIVDWETPTPTNHRFTFTQPNPLFFSFIFSLPLLVSQICLYSSGSKEKKNLTLLQMDVMASVSPPTLSPVSSRLWARQTLHV